MLLWKASLQKCVIIVGVVLLALTLSQCRYQLRGSQIDASDFNRTPVALKSTQPNSPFIKTLRQSMRALNTQLVPESQADVVLVIHDHVSWQNTRAVSSNTQIRNHNVNYKVNYQFTTATGDPLSPTRELAVARSYTTDDNQMLGATEEKWQVERELHQELSVQLLNQLRLFIAEQGSHQQIG